MEGEEGDQILSSITGRKDKTLLSSCQHSSAQRDFIDQRTAMQEPLLHPSDTIYHAASSPPSCALFFSPHRLSEHPVMQEGQKNFLKKKKKKGSFWCKSSRVQCKTGHIPTTYNKWTLSPGSKGNKLRFGGATWINSRGKRGFLP